MYTKRNTRPSFLMGACLAIALFIGIGNTYASEPITQVEQLSKAQIAAKMAAKMDDLHNLAEGKGDEYLNYMKLEDIDLSFPSEEDPLNPKPESNLCDDRPQALLKVFKSVMKFVPGVGKLPDFFELAHYSTVAAVCDGGSGLKYTWSQIMNGVDNRIDLKLAKDNRQKMENLIGYFSLEYLRKQAVLEEVESKSYSQAEITDLRETFKNLRDNIRTTEQAYSSPQKPNQDPNKDFVDWSQVLFISQLAILKRNVDIAILFLYQKNVGEEDKYDMAHAEQHFLNVEMPLSRAETMKAIARLNDNYFGRMYFNIDNSISYRSGSPKEVSASIVWPIEYRFHYYYHRMNTNLIATRHWTINFTDVAGSRDRSAHSSCRGRICHGLYGHRMKSSTWHRQKRRELATRFNEYKDNNAKMYATREYFRPMVSATNYFQGKQFAFVSYAQQFYNFPYTFQTYCLTTAANSNELVNAKCAPLYTKNNYETIEFKGNKEVPNLLWRTYDYSDKLIHEKSGLCLDLSDDHTTPVLNPCNYHASKNADTNDDSKDYQRWAILEFGLMVNLTTKQCLNHPRVNDDDSVTLKMVDCNTDLITPVIKPGLDSYIPPLRVGAYAQAQHWTVNYLTCSSSEECEFTHDLKKAFPFTPIIKSDDARTRHVLTADQVTQFKELAFLDNTTSGYTDSGYVNLVQNGAAAEWENLEIIRGKYRLTVFTEPGSSVLPEFKIQINGNEGEAKNTILLSEPTMTELGQVTYDINVPVYMTDLKLVSLNNQSQLVDKIMLTPLPKK